MLILFILKEDIGLGKTKTKKGEYKKKTFQCQYVRPKVKWNDEVEKPNKYFLTLESKNCE